MKRALSSLAVVLACLSGGSQLQGQERGGVAPAVHLQGQATPHEVRPVAHEQPSGEGQRTPASSASAKLTSEDFVGAAFISPDMAAASVSPSCTSAGCVSPSCGIPGCTSRGGCDGNCGHGTHCPLCINAGLATRVFGSVEYMIWWSEARELPPLVTTSPLGTPQANAGVYGLPTTTVLYGDDAIGGARQSGGRLTLGMWLNDSQNSAIVGRAYGNEGETEQFTTNTALNPILAIPFFNSDPLVNAEDALLVSYPNLTAGGVAVDTSNEVYGADIYLRTMIDSGRNYRIDLLGGYQYGRINDDLSLLALIDTGAAQIAINDSFIAKNSFNGISVGLTGDYTRGVFTLTGLAKIAFGNMHQDVTIAGQNTVVAGGAVTTPGGLFSQPTNIGNYERDAFAVSPEAGLTLSMAVTQRFDVSIGYTFLMWNRVALAGASIDRNVNGTQLLGGGPLVGPAQPAFQFNDDTFWVQTINLGGSFRY